MTEEWKNFPVMDGRNFSKYEVISLGQIRNKGTGYIFSTKPKCDGHVRNEFYDDDGNSKHIYAHVIVVRAFIDEPESDDLTVDHINRERADNRVVNLRWATKKQQTANSDRSKCIPIGQPVIQYDVDMEEIKRWPNIIAAERKLGIASSNIASVCKGKRKNAGGFKWAYERQDLDGEIWRNCDSMGVQVSNMGRIKSPRSHIVYGTKTSDGYLKYGDSQKRVHVMVAEAFLSNPENKPEVNHKDKNRVNNKVENLEWATRCEQAIHSHENSNPDRYITSSKAVRQYDLEGNLISEYRSMKEASRQTGCPASCIQKTCLGLKKSVKGSRFEYVDKDVSSPPLIKERKEEQNLGKKSTKERNRKNN